MQSGYIGREAKPSTVSLFQGRKLFLVSALFAVLFALPVLFLVFIAFSGDLESFSHIARTIMPRATLTTIILMSGIGVMVAIIGTISAWLVTFHEFPGRRVFEWALMLPLAVPTYISAYAFVEFFSYTGPLQELVREFGGFTSSREYRFPEIRSLWGTVLILGLVLYPYVYFTVRALFHFQGQSIIDSARCLGAGRTRLLFRIILPMARPAIILGVALALMESINDIGAVEHLGTRTLTHSIFSVWLNQNDFAGAAQIALLLLLVVVFLLALERASRGKRRFHETRATNSKTGMERQKLSLRQGLVATFACFLPILGGFIIPVGILGDYALQHFELSRSSKLVEALVTSVTFASIAAILATMIGLLFAYAVRVNQDSLTRSAVRLASSGYAVPGTLIALGCFLPLAMFDNQLDAFFRTTFGISTGLLITGSGVAMIFAYLVRFMAISEGTLDSGFSRISPNIDMAARSLGRNRWQILRSILFPIMRPAIATSALLVFVEVIKELSVTIMLRPFGVNTLATHVYDYASRARVEDAAAGCLLIIGAGIFPVIVMLHTARSQR